MHAGILCQDLACEFAIRVLASVIWKAGLHALGRG